eukprot:m.223370 g.223370  ORF g.223370 m.223370 type:complete len:1511 (+) comp18752_c0_seq2:97-4629(+)
MATKKAKKVLGELQPDQVRGKSGKDTKKTVEETYQKLSPLQHVLQRPDTYVGATEHVTTTMTCYEDVKGFCTREVSYVPALYKIFDEIIVNAADNKQRDPNMSFIKVKIDPEEGFISVENDGQGVPVEKHQKEQVWIPELIFGHLLTSSNYDDSEAKVTGGRNGYGAKLCNIFSTKFVVETCDGKKAYKQVFTDNMHEKQEPKIKDAKGAKTFTRISFTPDLEKFEMLSLEADMVALLTRRVYDMAGICRGVKVYLNGTQLPIRSFKGYVQAVIKSWNTSEEYLLHEKVNDRWEIAATVSENGFQQMSFVNSIATTSATGGTHVRHVTDQIVSKIAAVMKKKHKIVLKPQQIKSHLSVFVNCLIENPTFTSQTKEEMKLSEKKFGSTCPITDKAITDFIKHSSIVTNLLTFAKAKEKVELSKKSGKKKMRMTGFTKLEDANEAGGRKSADCTLILTEGDSAKALAMTGLSVVGRDYYGVFPLRGKLINVREASTSQLKGNAEIQAITQIMGLQFHKEYTDVKSLRYGKLMIMTDQDQDGSHIKGLLINFIHHFWPSLLKTDGFLIEFVTPIVKAHKGNKELSFFTLPQYQAWVDATPNAKNWKVKYYKGLGTSTAKEAKAYFSEMEKHVIPFEYSGNQDDESIVMAFSKSKVEQRKHWLSEFQPGTFLDHDTDSITYHEFIHKELILFSLADNVRSIPSMVDGFKPGQRKVIFSCFKRNLKEEIKVAQLAGYVAEQSAYHHGEVSLAGTIVNLAQDYVGSNNINMLVPAGQFGTRLQGGKDAASPRYIFTRLDPIARLVFSALDDQLLEYLTDDGQSIEPTWYMPILPLVLVNGSDGIGTGWSSTVPNYNPRDIVANLRRAMRGLDMEPMTPWYKGFKGEITQVNPNKFQVRGILEKIDDETISITELPVRTWTQSYKEFLEGLLSAEKTPSQIKDYKEHHTDTTVAFTVIMTPEQMAAAEAKGLYKFFKIESSLSTTNMTLFDSEGRIRKYESVQDIIGDFFSLRLKFYQKRKAWLGDQLTMEWTKLDNKVRFILAVIDGSLVISNRKKKELLKELQTKGYTPFPKKTRKGPATGADAEEDEENEDEEVAVSAGDYDYLLSMPMWNLTLEKVQKLKEERGTKEAELNELLAKSPEDLWEEDLDMFMEGLEANEAEAAASEAETAKLAKKAKSKKGLKAKPKKKKKAFSYSDDDDDDYFDDDDDDEYQPKTSKSRSKKASATAKQTTVAAAAAKKKTAVTAPVDQETPAPLSRAGSKHALSPEKEATKVKPAKPAKRSKAVKAIDLTPESEEDEPEPLSLADRLARMTTSVKTTTSKTEQKEARTDPLMSSADDDDEEAPKATKGSKRKARQTTEKPKVYNDFLSDESDNMDDDAAFAFDEPSPVVKKSKPAAKKAATKKAPAKKAPAKKAPAKKAAAPKKAPAAKKAPAKKTAAKKKPAVVSDDDDNDDMDLTSDSPVAPRAARGRRAAAKAIKYRFSDDEEEDNDDDVELLDSGDDFNPDDSDSDFEP